LNIFDEILKWVQITSIAVFLVLFLGKTLYLRRKMRLNAIILQPGKGRNNSLFSMVSVLVVNAWIAFILFYLLNATFRGWLEILDVEVLNSVWVKIPGLAVLVSAFILFIWAQLALGNSWRLGIDRRHPGKLVTREIYSLSRHPIYLFFDLYFFAVFLLNANLVFLLFNITIASVLHLQIMAEEKFMSEYYGVPYKEYASRVGMYFSLSRVSGLQDMEQSDTPD